MEITMGHYQLTEMRKSLFYRHVTQLHLHKISAKHALGLDELQFAKRQPNGDMVIECDDPVIVQQLELGKVYRIRFEPAEAPGEAQTGT
jgi:hypothetical protein